MRYAAAMVAILAAITAWQVAGGGSCTYPTCFPSASNTGVPAGITLTAYTGPTTITTDNTVIDSKRVTSCLAIQASGVVIKNSKLSCGQPAESDAFVIWCDDGGAGSCGAEAQPLTVQDSEIFCSGSGPSSEYGNGHGISYSNFIALRNNIHGCADGIFVDSDATIEDNYIHDLDNNDDAVAVPPDGIHADGIQFGDGHGGTSSTNGAINITIRHNRIEGIGWNPQHSPCCTQFTTSGIISSHHADTNIVIEKNLLMGGANTIYCNNTASGGANDVGVSVAVKNNHFSTLYSPRVAVATGYLGAGASDNGLPTTGCANEVGTGNGTGNVIHETGAAYTLDTVP